MVNVVGPIQYTVLDWGASPKLELNPRKQLFSSLNEVAKNYRQYSIERIGLQYEPQCSTLTPGSVSVSYSPNTQDTVPTAFQNFLN